MSRFDGRLILLVFLSCIPGAAQAQQNLFSRNFNHYPGVVPGIDFFATRRSEVVPFEKPMAEARQKLQLFLGDDLAPGAVFVCSSVEQRDSVYEPRAFRMGYRWVLMPLDPEISIQQAIERMKSRMGEEIPPERLERLKQRVSGMGSRMVETTVVQLGYAILMTTLAPEKEYRTSRLEDVNRSPLADWLDIGLAFYAAGAVESQLTYLQQHIDEFFPIEDILFMGRPVVVPTFADGGPGSPGGVRTGGPGSEGMGTFGEPSRASGSSSIPRDVQDRMMYDAQAASFFAHLLEAIGTEKVKEIIRSNRSGEDIQEILERPEFLGTDFEAVENKWLEWVKNQRLEPRGWRNRGTPASPPREPE